MYKRDILGFKGEIIGISFHGKRENCHVVKLNNELNALIALNGQLQPIFCEPEEIPRMAKICLDLCKNKVESYTSIAPRIGLLGENVRLAKRYVLVKMMTLILLYKLKITTTTFLPCSIFPLGFSSSAQPVKPTLFILESI